MELSEIKELQKGDVIIDESRTKVLIFTKSQYDGYIGYQYYFDSNSGSGYIMSEEKIKKEWSLVLKISEDEIKDIYDKNIKKIMDKYFNSGKLFSEESVREIIKESYPHERWFRNYRFLYKDILK